MTDRYKGFIAYFKKAIPGVFCIHCMIHLQHVVAKKLSGSLHDALHIVIEMVNHIKSNSLQDHPFRELCNQNGEDRGEMVIKRELPSTFY